MVEDGQVTDAPGLPHVDEHSTMVDAAVGDVWGALLTTLEHAFGRPAAGGYARLVRCVPAVRSGPRPLTEGSELPGFRVTSSVPGSELTLVGRHRFSTYALFLRIEAEGAGRCLVRAETRAAFPGAAGRIYRLLVITSRGHVFGVRRLLAATKRRAEDLAGQREGTTKADPE